MKSNHYDIIVVGGGLSGVCAAISSARLNKNVLLIEGYNCLGGAAAFDLVMPFMANSTIDPGTKEKIDLSGGLYLEILEGLKSLNHTPAPWDECFSEESLKLLLNRMCISSGVKLLFNSHVVGVNSENGKVLSLSVSNISGISNYSARCYIDATGDGNIAFLGGFPYRVGREKDNKCQPMTLCFRLCNVDTDSYKKELPLINSMWKKLQAEGRITNPRENLLIFDTVNKGILHFNSTRVIGLDPTDADELTKAEITGREQVYEIMEFLRSNFESFKGCSLLSTGIRIGARESRMIEGEYTLTGEDIIYLRKFDDGIALCNYDIDIHSPDGSGTSHYFLPEGEYYSIPYRCLIPKGSKNLIVTGRCISADHEAQASLRIMPCCCSLGEAAGAAAFLSCEGSLPVNRISVDRLQEILISKNAKI